MSGRLYEAYDQYALDAFRVNSIDYLLKPIKESDLRRAVEKLEHLTRAGMGEYSRRIGSWYVPSAGRRLSSCM